jgi:hypothetical protein
MEISIITAIDRLISDRVKRKAIPLAIKSLEKTDHVDYALRESTISRLRGRQYHSQAEHAVMSISFDPKTCDIPKEYCSGDCGGCCYNPLTDLLNPYFDESAYVITCRGTIATLLDTISLLAKANCNALLRENAAIEFIHDLDSDDCCDDDSPF